MSPTSLPTGWWKRRWLKRARTVEYHFLPELSALSPGTAVCGEQVGPGRGEGKPVDLPPKPWTHAPSEVARKFLCAECLRRLEP